MIFFSKWICHTSNATVIYFNFPVYTTNNLCYKVQTKTKNKKEKK